MTDGMMEADGWIGNGAVSEVECKVRQDGPEMIAETRGTTGLDAGVGLGLPSDFDLAMLSHAVTEIQVDEALVRDTGLHRHILEVEYNLLGEAHGDGLFELRSVRILARLHLGKIVFRFHGYSPP
jgi:hypothetical protein